MGMGTFNGDASKKAEDAHMGHLCRRRNKTGVGLSPVMHARTAPKSRRRELATAQTRVHRTYTN